MRTAELAPFRPTAEVLALGEPERVFADSPAVANICRAACAALGVLLALGAAGLAGWFWLLAPAEVQAKVPELAIALACGGAALVAAMFLASAHFYGHASAFALFPDALALTRRGVWTVIPWCDVRAFHPLSLRAFPHLELRDGTKVPLGADGSSFAEELYREIQRNVESPFTLSRAEAPAAGRPAPVEAPDAPEAEKKEESPAWGMLVGGAGMILAAAFFYLYLEHLESKGGEFRIHWLIAMAYNLGGKLAASALIAVVGVAVFMGGLNGLMNGKRPERRRQGA